MWGWGAPALSSKLCSVGVAVLLLLPPLSCRRQGGPEDTREEADAVSLTCSLLPPARTLCVQASGGRRGSSSFSAATPSSRCADRAGGQAAARCICSLAGRPVAVHTAARWGQLLVSAPSQPICAGAGLRSRHAAAQLRLCCMHAACSRAAGVSSRCGWPKSTNAAAARIAAAARSSPALGCGTLPRARRMMTRLFRHRYCLPEAVPPGAGAQRGLRCTACRRSPAGGRPTWGERTHNAHRRRRRESDVKQTLEGSHCTLTHARSPACCGPACTRRPSSARSARRRLLTRAPGPLLPSHP